MKKLLLSFTLVLLSSLCFAQKEKESEVYKKAVSNFELNYNSDNIDAIFLSFTPKFQQESPLSRTKDFLTSLKNKVGKITKKEFVRYEENQALYKTTFEGAIIALGVSVDDSGKINSIAVNPYKEDSHQKPERTQSN